MSAALALFEKKYIDIPNAHKLPRITESYYYKMYVFVKNTLAFKV